MGLEGGGRQHTTETLPSPFLTPLESRIFERKRMLKSKKEKIKTRVGLGIVVLLEKAKVRVKPKPKAKVIMAKGERGTGNGIHY